jgi:hypothetical protein
MTVGHTCCYRPLYVIALPVLGSRLAFTMLFLKHLATTACSAKLQTCETVLPPPGGKENKNQTFSDDRGSEVCCLISDIKREGGGGSEEGHSLRKNTLCVTYAVNWRTERFLAACIKILSSSERMTKIVQSVV